jgi:hypothetical protein
MCVCFYSLCWLSAPLSPCVPSLHFIHPASGTAHIVPEWALDLRLCERSRSAAAASETRALVWVRDPLLSRTPTHKRSQMRDGDIMPAVSASHFKCTHMAQNLILCERCEAHAFVLRLRFTLLFSLYPFFKLLMESDL